MIKIKGYSRRDIAEAFFNPEYYTNKYNMRYIEDYLVAVQYGKKSKYRWSVVMHAYHSRFYHYRLLILKFYRHGNFQSITFLPIWSYTDQEIKKINWLLMQSDRYLTHSGYSSPISKLRIRGNKICMMYKGYEWPISRLDKKIVIEGDVSDLSSWYVYYDNKEYRLFSLFKKKRDSMKSISKMKTLSPSFLSKLGFLIHYTWTWPYLVPDGRARKSISISQGLIEMHPPIYRIVKYYAQMTLDGWLIIHVMAFKKPEDGNVVLDESTTIVIKDDFAYSFADKIRVLKDRNFFSRVRFQEDFYYAKAIAEVRSLAKSATEKVFVIND